MIELQYPDPPALYVAREKAAEMLQLTRHSFDALLVSGMLPSLEYAAVRELASRPWATSWEKIVVFRAGPPGVDPDHPGRRTGYEQDYTDEEVCDAARRWHVSNPDDVVKAGHIIVTRATYAVALLRVTGLEETAGPARGSGRAAPRRAYAAELVARVDDLLANKITSGYIPAPLDALLPILGARVWPTRSPAFAYTQI